MVLQAGDVATPVGNRCLYLGAEKRELPRLSMVSEGFSVTPSQVSEHACFSVASGFISVADIKRRGM